MDENSKTLKNIYLNDNHRGKSVSSGSLIRKNFIGQRYSDVEDNKVIFGDKTNKIIFGDKTNKVIFGDKTNNVWNSKYASIDQIMKGNTYKNN